jgi:hypothetical protein
MIRVTVHTVCWHVSKETQFSPSCNARADTGSIQTEIKFKWQFRCKLAIINLIGIHLEILTMKDTDEHAYDIYIMRLFYILCTKF